MPPRDTELLDYYKSQGIDLEEKARVEFLKSRRPKTWVGQALHAGEWTLGYLGDVASRQLWIPLAEAAASGDPVAQYRLEELKRSRGTPIYAGDVLEATGLLKTAPTDPLAEKITKGVGRFAASVFGDPLTYIPFGAVTKVGRATKYLKRAAEEGREILPDSKLGKLAKEVFGEEFFKIPEAQVKGKIEELTKAVAEKIPVKKLAAEDARLKGLVEETLKANTQAYFYWGGSKVGKEIVSVFDAEAGKWVKKEILVKSPRKKIFVGSEQHRRIVQSTGVDPVAKGNRQIHWTIGKQHGMQFTIPPHLSEAEQTLLKELHTKWDVLNTADRAASVEGIVQKWTPDLNKAQDEFAQVLAEAMQYHGNIQGLHALPAVKAAADKLQGVKDAIKKAIEGAHSLAAGPSEQVVAAKNTYDLAKQAMLRSNPLTTQKLMQLSVEEAKKINQLVKIHAPHLVDNWGSGVDELKKLDIPEINQAFKNLNLLSQSMKKAGTREAILSASVQLMSKMKIKQALPPLKEVPPELLSAVKKELLRQKIKELPSAIGKPLSEQIKSGERSLFHVELPGGIEIPVPILGRGTLAESVAKVFTRINRIGLVSKVEKLAKGLFSTSTGHPEYDRLLTTFKSLALHRAGMEVKTSVEATRELKALAKELKIEPAQLEATISKLVERETAGVPIRELRRLIGPIAQAVQVTGGKARATIAKVIEPLTKDLMEPIHPGSVLAGEIPNVEPLIPAPKGSEFKGNLEAELAKEFQVKTKGSNWGANLEELDVQFIDSLDTKDPRDVFLLKRIASIARARAIELDHYRQHPETFAKGGVPWSDLLGPVKLGKKVGETKIVKKAGYGKVVKPTGLQIDITPKQFKKTPEAIRALKGSNLEQTLGNLDQAVGEYTGLQQRAIARLKEVPADFKLSYKGTPSQPVKTVVDEVKAILREQKKVSLDTYVPSPAAKLVQKFRERKIAQEQLLRSSGIQSIPPTTDPEFLWNSLTTEARQEVQDYLIRSGMLKAGFRKGHFRKEAMKLFHQNFVIVDPDQVDLLVLEKAISEKEAATLKSKRGFEKLQRLFKEKRINEGQYTRAVFTLGPQDVNDLAAQHVFPWQRKPTNIQQTTKEIIPEGTGALEALYGATGTETIPFGQKLGSTAPGTSIFEVDPIYSASVRGIRGQQVLTANEFYNELIKRGIGVKPDQAPEGYLAVPQELLKGYLFPPEIARSLGKYQEIQYNDEVIRKLLRIHDVTQDTWKAWTLAIFPAYHTRNVVGNIWNNWLAGVSNPKWYVYAERMFNPLSKDSFTFVDGLGKKWSKEEVIKVMRELGVMDRGFVGADVESTLHQVLGKGGLGQKLGRGNKVVEWGFKLGTQLENRARAAHFMSKLAEGMTPDDAAMSVKRYLFDYGDLTDFERNVLKRWFPFYTWTRNNIPLQISHLVTQPAKFSIPYKARAAIEDADQSPNEKYLPQWVQENYPTRIRFNKKTNNYEYFLAHSWLPAMDVVKLLEIHETAVNMLTPIPKEVIQQLFNYDFFLKRKISTLPGQKERIFGLDFNARLVHTAKLLRILKELDQLSAKDQDFTEKLTEALTSKTYVFNEQRARLRNKKEVDEKLKSIRSAMIRQSSQVPKNPKEMNRLRKLFQEAAREY